MRVSRGLLREWEAIPEEYTGVIIFHCAEGHVKRIEHHVVKKLDDLNVFSITNVKPTLDNPRNFTVEHKR